jgi:hypothetical protein
MLIEPTLASALELTGERMPDSMRIHPPHRFGGAARTLIGIRWGFCYIGAAMRTIIYIDGFNLYYRYPDKSLSRQLYQYASFVKPIRQSILQNSQFPPVLADSTGAFHKPKSW